MASLWEELTPLRDRGFAVTVLAGTARAAAGLALEGIQNLPLPNQARLARMRGQIPEIQIGDVLELGPEWQAVRDRIVRFKDSGQ